MWGVNAILENGGPGGGLWPGYLPTKMTSGLGWADPPAGIFP